MSRYRIIFALSLIAFVLYGQDIDEAIRLFNAFQFDRAQEIFEAAIKKPDDLRVAEAYYYLGRLAVDPDSAIYYYDLVVKNYPQSRYVDISYLEIAKINIARENYKNAIVTLNELQDKFSDTNLKDEVLFWLGVAAISVGDKEQGLRALKTLKTSFPKSVWSARANDIISTGEFNNEYFTIQVGSFLDKNNAQKLLENLKAKGYRVSIAEANVMDNTYYRVWVGQFYTIEDAKAFSHVLDSSGIKGNVVKGY